MPAPNNLRGIFNFSVAVKISHLSIALSFGKKLLWVKLSSNGNYDIAYYIGSVLFLNNLQC